jgi:FAD/FMN-containing dehydrogenase
MIDFSRMNAVTIVPKSETAIVQPGAKLGDLDRESSKHGLLTTGGIVSSTGVAGLTLGGGIGYLGRKYGLALDNVISLDVITADGKLLHCSKSENTD